MMCNALNVLVNLSPLHIQSVELCMSRKPYQNRALFSFILVDVRMMVLFVPYPVPSQTHFASVCPALIPWHIQYWRKQHNTRAQTNTRNPLYSHRTHTQMTDCAHFYVVVDERIILLPSSTITKAHTGWHGRTTATGKRPNVRMCWFFIVMLI